MSDRAVMKAWIALLLSLVAVVALSRPPELKAAGETAPPLLPRPEVMQVLGAFDRPLFADYFWLMTIQQIGLAQKAGEYRAVADYARLAVALDPDFREVYRVAGLSIPFNLGREKWVNTEESTAILAEGVARFPDDPRLGIPYAYNLSFFHRQYERAGELLGRLAKRPGAPRYLGQLSARLYAMVGRFDDGLELTRSLAAEASDPESRALFEDRAREIEQERLLREVEVACNRFTSRSGRAPSALLELVAAGDLPGLPMDPLGGDISLEDECKARSSSRSRRLKVFLPHVDD